MHSDLSKAYEAIPLEVVRNSLLQVGCDAGFVQVVHCAYQMPKLMVVYQHPRLLGQAVRGIPAGCALAVWCMGIVTHTLVHQMQIQVPLASLRFFVDDSALWCKGQGRQDEEPQALTSAVALFEDWCGCLNVELNQKTVIWSTGGASSKELEQEMFQKFSRGNSVRDLGIDLPLAARNVQPTQRIRIRDSIQRVHRLQRCDWSRAEREMAVQSLVLTKALFGCELYGAPIMLVTELRKAVVAFLRHGDALGRSAHGVLTVAAGQAHLDPVLRVHTLTLSFWHRWIRHAQEVPSTMHRAWQHAERHARQHGRAEGPIKHLWSSMSHLGWKAHTAGSWETQDGQLLNLLDCVPGLFQHELRRAAMGAACRALASERSDFQGSRMMSKELLRSVMARLTQQARNEYSFHLSGGGPSWSEHAARLSKDTKCPLCGGSPCTWQHSLWECAEAHAHRDEDLLRKCRQLKAPPCFLQRGLIEESLDWGAAGLTGSRARKDFCLRFVLALLQRKAQWLRVTEGRMDALPIIPSTMPVRTKRAT
eukprot:6479668-Amphidinium_carterae.3